jgi:hypothetical protein
MMLLAVLVGLALAFFGRQLFWLFVGGAGFAAGMVIATDLLQGQSELMVLVIAVLAGIIGALLSIFLQRLAIGLAGFVAGGYALMNLAAALGRQDWAWLGFIVGGVVGALLVMVLFDWALIFLSALTGALLVVDNIKLDPAISLLVFAVLLIAGILAQAAQLRRTVPAAPAPSAPERVEPR